MQDNTLIPTTIDVTLLSPVSTSFRCQCAANSLDIDVKKKSTHHLHIDDVVIPKNWNIGLVVGASGSGKTTLIKHLFGDDVFDYDIDPEKPIIEQLPSTLNYDECAKILNGIGLTSVPCWIRPYKTLSNGQQARAQAAYLLTKSDNIVCIDEWTSVVDRTVAKAMSVCVDKFTRCNNKRIILCSCHYDIIEWLRPDWIIDCNKQKFQLPQSDAFFFQEREKLQFNIKRIDAGSWQYFSKYHYLSEKLPGGGMLLLWIIPRTKSNRVSMFCQLCAASQGNKNYNAFQSYRHTPRLHRIRTWCKTDKRISEAFAVDYGLPDNGEIQQRANV